MTMRCENPSMSVSPGSNSGRILSTPSTSCLAPRPLGISLVFLYGLLTKPIGCEVNIGESDSIHILMLVPQVSPVLRDLGPGCPARHQRCWSPTDDQCRLMLLWRRSTPASRKSPPERYNFGDD